MFKCSRLVLSSYESSSASRVFFKGSCGVIMFVYGRVEIGKRSCTVQCQSDSNRVGLDNRRNRDRVDREVIGYQLGISCVEVGKIVSIVKRSGISRALVG